ncbi:MAG TPA: hypothetical protein VJ385_02650 [Fibrobacteria bacterium]|nr:hypothetical protein [Fibrobacteria bacterium]
MTSRIPCLPIPRGTGPIRILAPALAAMLILAVTKCTSEPEPSSPAAGAAITLVTPKGGETFGLDDTLKIISESDYTRFGANLTFAFSEDSGKSWILIESLERKKNGTKERDTVKWVPLDFAIAPGPVLVRVREYDKVYAAVSGFVTLGPAVKASP